MAVGARRDANAAELMDDLPAGGGAGREGAGRGGADLLGGEGLTCRAGG